MCVCILVTVWLSVRQQFNTSLYDLIAVVEFLASGFKISRGAKRFNGSLHSVSVHFSCLLESAFYYSALSVTQEIKWCRSEVTVDKDSINISLIKPYEYIRNILFKKIL